MEKINHLEQCWRKKMSIRGDSVKKLKKLIPKYQVIHRVISKHVLKTSVSKKKLSRSTSTSTYIHNFVLLITQISSMIFKI